MPYEIVIHELADEELERFRVHDQRRIVGAIKKQLRDQPTTPTRNRKCLEPLIPAFEYVPPLWELRVGDFRVFYDVDESRRMLHIRSVRRKEPTQQTEDII